MSDDKAFNNYLKWRKTFVLKIILVHFALIFVFDLLAIFAPDIMATMIFSDKVISIGVIFAFGIIFSVIGSTFYYSSRIDREVRLVNQFKKESR